MIEGLGIYIAPDFAGCQQCLDLGCKGETAAPVEIIERLHADSVSHKKQRLLALVENREGEHTSQQAQHIFAVFLIKVDEYFGVRIGVKNDSVALEAASKLGKVINLAIERNP